MMRFVFKICLLGPPGVGKTSLVLRYVKNYFKNEYLTTLGADFLIKELVLKQFDVKIKLCIWDIGGQSRWESLRPVYLQGADGAIVVCDLTKKSTFRQLPRWVMDLETYAGDDLTPYIIVGNKLDLCKEEFELREVKSSDLLEYGKEQGKYVFETSAKT
ncbi:MAG: Rab family GTPase, partial [Candidatus Helarchaeales archaeon]